jgi:succinoglycan biosynthesis protein ExoM
MTMEHISICLCTYQRPIWLRQLLQDLVRQETMGRFTFEIIVVDNDAAESAREVVREEAGASAIPIRYFTESRRSIAYARNKTLEHASGSFIAFIDDDELPQPKWLFNLFHACTELKVAGVLGPVRPRFEPGTPNWVKKGGFYDRAEHPTGFLMTWRECRTGNVLFDRTIIGGLDPVFSPEFGTGGSDVDFFRRMTGAGHKFVWCSEAVVYEIVPPSRWKRGVLIRRALLRGRNSLRHREGRLFNLVKAMVAIPLYTLALPLLLLAGQHCFMKYLIKLCDHTGRLLAAIGITPVRERAM